MHERRLRGASGANWLFFGEQHQACAFYYRDELTSLLDAGVLTHLDLAFSRDQSDKVYVQDRMRVRGADIWTWLDAGAHVYVCGDADNMAKGVHAELITIVECHGAMSRRDAEAYVADMARTKRYARDVY